MAAPGWVKTGIILYHGMAFFASPGSFFIQKKAGCARATSFAVPGGDGQNDYGEAET